MQNGSTIHSASHLGHELHPSLGDILSAPSIFHHHHHDQAISQFVTGPSFTRQDARNPPTACLAPWRSSARVGAGAATLARHEEGFQLHRRRDCLGSRRQEEYTERYQAVGQERSDTSLGAAAWYDAVRVIVATDG